MKIGRIFVLAAALLFLLASCQAPKTCYEQADEVGFIDGLDDIIQQWDDANVLANSTARGSLSGPIADLQAIVRDTRKLEAPECAVNVRDSLAEAMSDKVDIYITFMSDADADLAGDLSLNETKFETYFNYYDTLMESKPE